MTQTLSFRVLLEMTSTVAQEKVIPLNTEESEAQVVSNLKLKMNGNKKILRRDTKKEKTDSSFSPCSQEQVQSLVAPRSQ
jgi:hypothetical protein